VHLRVSVTGFLGIRARDPKNIQHLTLSLSLSLSGNGLVYVVQTTAIIVLSPLMKKTYQFKTLKLTVTAAALKLQKGHTILRGLTTKHR